MLVCYVGSPPPPRLHLRHSISWFDPRVHDGRSSLYKQPYTCDRTAQFIQGQVWLSPFNMLMCAHFHLYKPGSPPSVTKDLGKLTS